MIEDADQRRLASQIFDEIGDQFGIDVFVHKYGPNAEGGWRVEAFKAKTGEQWITESESVLVTANELAKLVGFDWKH